MNAASQLHLNQTPEGVELPVKVVPGSSRCGVAGVWDGALRLAVTAPPEGGRANRQVVRLLANVAGVRRADVEIVSGATRPLKRVLLRGAQQQALLASLRKELA
jgi:uncharacterized protein (TIGR00251 family)